MFDPYENIIVVDIDGVLLNFLQPLHFWLTEEKGYIFEKADENYDISDRYNIDPKYMKSFMFEFFQTPYFKKLPPYKDAVKWVRKLHEEHGYVFHCISAVPNIDSIKYLRRENLETLFGKTVFQKIIHCDIAQNKKKILEKYKDSDCYWIEDNPQNLNYGLDVGMKGLLMNNFYNKNVITRDYTRVQNWQEIYDLII